MVEDLKDPRRTEPAMVGLDERSMLEGWLEFHRMTLLLKCEGVDAEGLLKRPVATSKLSLQGLLRHMGEVERSWFQRVLERDPNVPYLLYDPSIEDSDFIPPGGSDWEKDRDAWLEECERSRRAAAKHTLDDVGVTRSGKECSLRWIYTHMIEEYARHNGHADLIREMVDGEVGW
jgi:hypothetical protein